MKSFKVPAHERFAADHLGGAESNRKGYIFFFFKDNHQHLQTEQFDQNAMN